MWVIVRGTNCRYGKLIDGVEALCSTEKQAQDECDRLFLMNEDPENPKYWYWAEEAGRAIGGSQKPLLMYVIVMEYVINGLNLTYPLAVCENQDTAEKEAKRLNNRDKKDFQENYWVKPTALIKASQEGEKNV